MPSELDQAVGKVLAATGEIPSGKIDELLRTLDDPNAGGKTLDELLVENKLIDADQAAQVRESAKEIVAAPDIPGHTIIKKLGEGGMGAVFKAKHDKLGREVAVKILPARLAKDQAFVERFCREARASTVLDHPNVVKGFDLGETPDIHYFIMELIDGKSVQDLIGDNGKLSIGDAVKIIHDVALALEHAQEHKLIHRDIKPDNIMITKKGVVKLADLGLAKQMDDSNSMTQTGSGFGTPYYMPPEQGKDAKHVDQRSDIYALGATLYRLLAGRVPYDGTTALEVLLAKEKGTHSKASAFNPEVKGTLNMIIDKMMAKEPKQRYQTATELLNDLDKHVFHNEVLSEELMKKIDESAVAAKPQRRTSTGRSDGSSAGSAGSGSAGAPAAGPATAKAAAKDDTIWYLQYKDATGKLVKTKANTAKIRSMVMANQLDESVEAGQSPKGPFRRLHSYSEFEPMIRARMQKKSADKKAEKTGGSKMADLVANIDKEQRKHKFKQKLGDMWFKLTSLILGLAIFGGGGYFVWKNFLGGVVEDGKSRVSELQKQIDSEKARSGRK